MNKNKEIKATQVTYEVTYTDGICNVDTTITSEIFYYDGCHRIYIPNSQEDIEEMRKLKRYTPYNMDKLEEVYNNSCSLKFIDGVSGDNSYVPQFVKIRKFQKVYASNEKSVEC